LPWCLAWLKTNFNPCIVQTGRDNEGQHRTEKNIKSVCNSGDKLLQQTIPFNKRRGKNERKGYDGASPGSDSHILHVLSMVKPPDVFSMLSLAGKL
jgi:hypothetical protein